MSESINFIEWDKKNRQCLIRLAGNIEPQEKRLEKMKAAEDMYEALKVARGLIAARLPECLTHLEVVDKALAKAEGE